jgi:drug/metabolite transporter (DMT)-like permease
MDSLGGFIVEISGTPDGRSLALILVMISAVAHAVFGAINKGGTDPYLNRGAINLSYGLMAAPIALFVVPLPSPTLWIALAIGYVIHIIYEYFQALSYAKGEFTLVYPIARGTGPLLTFLFAGVIFGEVYSSGQWIGAFCLSGAIVGLGLANSRDYLRRGKSQVQLRAAIGAALGTGITLAAYTIVDAYGVRLADNPFTFLAWFFTLGGLGFPIIAARRYALMTERPPIKPLVIRGIIGAFVAYISFGSVILATRLDTVGKIAALRETSVVFAAVIGIVFFRERLGLGRAVLIGIVAVGAVLVEWN